MGTSSARRGPTGRLWRLAKGAATRYLSPGNAAAVAAGEVAARYVAALGEAGGPSLGLGSHSDVRGRNADPARHLVGLATDDLRADWKRLKAAGVEFVENPTDYDTVSIATLKDPEGNLVQLLQRRS